MAPASLPPEDGWEPPVPVEIHFVVAHWSQVWVVMVQIEPSGHDGQVGEESPHGTQRLKRERDGEKAESIGSSMMGENNTREVSTRPVNGVRNVQSK
jgi:hypothetical protein